MLQGTAASIRAFNRVALGRKHFLVVGSTRFPLQGHNSAIGLIRSLSTLEGNCDSPQISVNGNTYLLPKPGVPVVGICMDGTSQDYVSEGMKAGAMPNLVKILDDSASRGDMPFSSLLDRNKFTMSRGTHGLVTSAYPTFTNPNNVSIMTGVLPNKHGISGNYYIDDEGKEVLMTSPDLIRCNSIFAAMADAGVKVTIVTIKNKLRRLLSHELTSNNAHCFSIEALSSHSHDQLVDSLRDPNYSNVFGEAGMDNALRYAFNVSPDLTESQVAPTPYHSKASAFGLRFGSYLAKSIMQLHPQARSLFYITTTDYVQHIHEPGAKESNSLMRELDQAIGVLHEAGAIVGFTADHGMNDKCRYNGEPRVVYLSDELQKLGYVDGENVRVILPITDPYIVHHAALGSCAFIKLIRKPGTSAMPLDEKHRIMREIRSIPGVYTVVGAEDAAKSFDWPIDGIGDFVVLGDQQTALGSSERFHAPQLLEAMSQRSGQETPFRLRSHGGMDESTVPLFVNRALTSAASQKLTTGKARNFDLYSILLNGIHPESVQAKL